MAKKTKTKRYRQRMEGTHPFFEEEEMKEGRDTWEDLLEQDALSLEEEGFVRGYYGGEGEGE